MSVNSKMKAIADPIRTLMGATDQMGLDAMANNLGKTVTEVDTQNAIIEKIKAGLAGTEEYIGMTNNEIGTQSDLIQQIKTALTDKAAGGVELPTLTKPAGTSDDLAQGKQLIGADGSVVEGNVRVVTSIQAFDSNVETFFDDDGLNLAYRPNLPVLIDNDDGDVYPIVLGTTDLGNAKREDVPQGVTFTSKNGLKMEGSVKTPNGLDLSADFVEGGLESLYLEGTVTEEDVLLRKGKWVGLSVSLSEIGNFGDARPEDVRDGVYFTSASGYAQMGTALIPGGGFVYPDGAFAPVTNFTDGKQYALVAVIDGVRRYLNNTTFNDWTMNATEITIAEDAGDYVLFSATPALFTAVASGDGFLLQNGSNYLHGTSSGGTALRFGTTQMVWTVDTSANGGFPDGKYYAKEDSNAVWLMNADGGYAWSIKYETAGSFGYDRDGRDSTYSTGFVPVVLYEYVAGEGELNPIVDSSDANVTANKMLAGYSGYANGRKVEGNIQSRQAATITPSTTAQEIPAGVYLEGKQTIAAIQTETKSVTENGTYTPSSGKYFSIFTVNVPTGNGGSVIKTGTTTSATIATGLSSIEEFFIYKESISATGLIHLHYSKTDGTSYLYASAWSTSSYGTKTVKNDTTAATVSGGSITLPSSTATSGGLSSGVTYTWVAIGTE